VPIIGVLAPELAAHKLRSAGTGDALVFGATAELPFEPSTVRRRALAAWASAELEPIGLHECRHTFASLLIAAGVNAKAITEAMGHATIAFDRYGHLMPGSREETRSRIDAFLAAGPALAPRRSST
jgi:integrase